MSSFSDYLEDAVLNYVFRNTGTPTSTSVYLALFTVAPTDAGGGTEVTGAGYARPIVAFDAAIAGATANTDAEAFIATGGNYGDVLAVGIFDAVTAGNLLAWDTIATATVNDGDTINFAIGAIAITLT
jgi:hypothetical protein